MIPRTSPKQPDNVLSHWYVLTDGTQFSAQDFYGSVEDELAARKVPRLKSSRVEFSEGGPVSDKRTYLRLARERYAFDVCAAPFGTGYFFSLRLVEKPRSWFQLFALGALLLILWNVGERTYWEVRQHIILVLGIAVAAAGAYLFYSKEVRSPREMTSSQPAEDSPVFPTEMPDLDAFLLNLAVIGDWYERIRKDTYHRHDTRLIYHTLVSDIVKKKVGEVTSAKGVKLIRTYDYSPILGELYKRKVVKTGQDDEETAA